MVIVSIKEERIGNCDHKSGVTITIDPTRLKSKCKLAAHRASPSVRCIDLNHFEGCVTILFSS